MLKKIVNIILIIVIVSNIINIKYVTAEEMDLEDFVRQMKEYSGDIIDVEKDSSALMTGKGIDEKGILIKICNLFIEEIRVCIKDIYIIFVIVILMSIVKNISIDLDSSSKKITTLAFTLMTSIVGIKIFLVILKIFKTSIVTFITVFEIAIPFLMTLLIVTGKITTTSAIGPSILFIVQSIGYIVEVIIIPFSIISLVLTIVSSINDSMNLDGVIKFFNKTSLVILSGVFGVFLLFLALESSITVSIDGVYGKTVNAASSLVPVVGKFISESMTGVVGSIIVIKKVAGTVTIILLLQIILIPIIKITCIIFGFSVLKIFTEVISKDEKQLINILEKFSDTYKFLLGVLFSISSISIIALGVIINIGSTI